MTGRRATRATTSTEHKEAGSERLGRTCSIKYTYLRTNPTPLCRIGGFKPHPGTTAAFARTIGEDKAGLQGVEDGKGMSVSV